MQSVCRDSRALPAGGATEIEVARQLTAFGAKMTGLEQYAIAKFAEALEVVPRTIAENSGEGSGPSAQFRVLYKGLAYWLELEGI